MSVLSEAVAEKLPELVTGGLTLNEIETILGDFKVPTSATRAVPVPLRVTRIRFWGTKELPPTHPTAKECNSSGEQLPSDDTKGSGDGVEPVRVSFNFDWMPQVGVNGIGSGKNLRGKSTVLNVLMWALTGRCSNFQPDIQHWVEGVAVDWRVGPETIRVRFSAADGHPTGVVEIVQSDDSTREIGSFEGPEQFEGVMGSVMMSRLRLEQIPVWTQDREVRHAWPAYSSALTVRADALNPVVGNETTIGVRMLQMFVGTDWAPAAAAAKTAVRALDTQRDAMVAKASAASEAVREAREAAQQKVDEVTANIAALPAGALDVTTILASASRATELARAVHNLERRLMAESAALDTINLQLRSAKARQHTSLEDARLNKFFHRMKPTVCPRCASPVTKEQQAAEVEKHECSLCTKDLNLEAYNAEILISASVPDDEAVALMGTADDKHDEDEDEESGPVSDIDALEAAHAAAEQSVAALQTQVTQKIAERDQAEADGNHTEDLLTAASERHTLELDLARAQGALGALTEPIDPSQAHPINPTIAAVLDAADDLLSEWVRHGQIPLLEDISADIEKLAVSFGADNLRDLKLGGSGRLDVTKGGQSVTYSKLTPGEKLRVKIATAIALIKHGFASGVGRHPGLLVLDSPAAEEMPEEDLATIIEALKAVAEEAEMQIFVATRNAGPIVDLLPDANRRVAVGDAYVW